MVVCQSFFIFPLCHLQCLPNCSFSREKKNHRFSKEIGHFHTASCFYFHITGCKPWAQVPNPWGKLSVTTQPKGTPPPVLPASFIVLLVLPFHQLKPSCLLSCTLPIFPRNDEPLRVPGIKHNAYHVAIQQRVFVKEIPTMNQDI